MRDLLIIGGMSVAAIVIGVLLFFFGPSSLQSDFASGLHIGASGPVSFSTITKGNAAVSITDRTNYRIQTADQLKQLWPLIYGDKDRTVLPNVDFNRYEVLALFDGSHSSSGYGLNIASVTDANAVRTVTIQHLSPGKNCRINPTDSSPFVLIQVPKTKYTLAHVDTEQKVDCPLGN